MCSVECVIIIGIIIIIRMSEAACAPCAQRAQRAQRTRSITTPRMLWAVTCRRATAQQRNSANGKFREGGRVVVKDFYYRQREEKDEKDGQGRAEVI